MTANPLSQLAGLSKPATTLIEKVSDAIGGVFKPHQIVRVAKAEAEAARIQAASQIEITDLHRRAMHRFLEEEAKKQENIEAITKTAIPLLEDKSMPEKVEDDWITNFFDKSRIVSDADMQLLWARVLAGEANAPGAFSRKTINLLADLEKTDAQLFTRLCRFNWTIRQATPLVFQSDGAIYNNQGINFQALSHLESLGLINLDAPNGFKASRLPKKMTVSYFRKQVPLILPSDENNILPIGLVFFTRAGQELAPISGAEPLEDFFEYVCERWRNQGLFQPSETE
jgi:hypothetical protein